MKHVREPHERVIARTAPEGDCLLWLGARNGKGYGTVGTGSRTDGTRRTVLAHKAVWEAVNGPVPAGMELDHTCRVRHCVRLEHLQPVTHLENCQRADHSARVAAIRDRTHCKRGHEVNEANTRVRPNGARACRVCLRDRARRERAAA